MRVACIAPTRRTSGAAIYSEKLYSRFPSQIVSGEGSISDLITTLARQQADVYHIQFEYRGFGGFGRSLLLLVALSFILRLRRPVVVTLHGIITRASLEGRYYSELAFLVYFVCVKITAKLSDAIIVPTELMRATLRQVYSVTNTVVIPLGTDAPKQVNPRKPGPSLIFSYGFVRPHKGLDILIDAVAQVRKTHPEINMTVAGGIARQEEVSYLNYLRKKVEESAISPYVEFVNRSLSEEEKSRLLSETVAVVLPYTDRFVECSAVVHDVAGYGVPLICSEAPRFSELCNGFDCLKVKASPGVLANAILTLLDDPKMARKIADNLKVRANSESWNVVAGLHLDLYRRVCGFEERDSTSTDPRSRFEELGVMGVRKC